MDKDQKKEEKEKKDDDLKKTQIILQRILEKLDKPSKK